MVPNEGLQGDPADPLHDDHRSVANLDQLVDIDDIRVADLREHLRFVARSSDDTGPVKMISLQHFQRDELAAM